MPGIGPKTAAAVLSEAGSLENFFADPELVTNAKLRAKLQENRERIQRNIKLVTLRTQWPQDELGEVEKYLVKRPPDWQKIAGFARQYELKSILKDIPEEFTAPSAPAAELEIATAPAEENSAPADDLFSWSIAREEQTAGKTPEQTPEPEFRQDTLF